MTTVSTVPTESVLHTANHHNIKPVLVTNISLSLIRMTNDWRAMQACKPKPNATKNHEAGCTDLHVRSTPGNWFSRDLTGSTYYRGASSYPTKRADRQAGKDVICLVTDVCESPDFSDRQSVEGDSSADTYRVLRVNCGGHQGGNQTSETA